MCNRLFLRRLFSCRFERSRISLACCFSLNILGALAQVCLWVVVTWFATFVALFTLPVSGSAGETFGRALGANPIRTKAVDSASASGSKGLALGAKGVLVAVH